MVDIQNVGADQALTKKNVLEHQISIRTNIDKTIANVYKQSKLEEERYN